ncbi:MAG: prefoldin subunit alpha [Nanoarchaeota archaeon]|nr:prefoldin subunit alpha [Nanoarchaeota archaeon]
MAKNSKKKEAKEEKQEARELNTIKEVAIETVASDNVKNSVNDFDDEEFHLPAKQKEVQQKYMELQMVDAQLKQIQKQMMSMEGQMEEIKAIVETLTELKSIEVGKELYVPITSGVFVKAVLKENEKVLVNVGSNTVVLKSVEEAKDLINRQLKEVDKVKLQLLEEFQRLALKSENLEKEMMGLVS